MTSASNTLSLSYYIQSVTSLCQHGGYTDTRRNLLGVSQSILLISSLLLFLGRAHPPSWHNSNVNRTEK